jgi:hypothetical protein
MEAAQAENNNLALRKEVADVIQTEREQRATERGIEAAKLLSEQKKVCYLSNVKILNFYL